MKKNEVGNEVKANVGKYTKDQILNSKRFSNYNKDVLVAILKKDTLYSISEAENTIKLFLERKV